MAKTEIRGRLDQLIGSTTSYDTKIIPTQILADIQNWKWGAYGWTSPASLIFTASWMKYFFPQQDCCKIWAKDEINDPIPGSYSIRSEDEAISIPLLAKHDLCKGFCSDNSGMQGSRAIEKMRNLKRLETNFSLSQRTVFDLKLFASILNRINSLNEAQSLEVLKLLICTAKSIQKGRIASDSQLTTRVLSTNILNFLETVSDPELTKCFAAACLNAIYNKHDLTIDGITDYKTASDARAEKPGDLYLTRQKEILISVEVKAKSIKIDWQNIGRAETILKAFPNLTNFIFILENRNALFEPEIHEMINSPRLSSNIGIKISFISVHDIYRLALATVSEAEITASTGKYLSEAPSVKPTTKDSWLKNSIVL
jgi:hypothetical protein